MKRKMKGSVTADLAIKNVVRGVITGILTTIAGAVIMSVLIINETLEETSIGYSAMGILLLASMAACMAALVNAQSKKGMIVGITGGLYALILMGLNALLYKGGYEGVGVTLLLILAGCLTSLLLFGKQTKRGYAPKRKLKHR